MLAKIEKREYLGWSEMERCPAKLREVIARITTKTYSDEHPELPPRSFSKAPPEQILNGLLRGMLSFAAVYFQVQEAAGFCPQKALYDLLEMLAPAETCPLDSANKAAEAFCEVFVCMLEQVSEEVVMGGIPAEVIREIEATPVSIRRFVAAGGASGVWD
jgi:hypothetical protein